MLTEMKGRLLLNVIARRRTALLKLLASKDEALLVGRNAFLILDFRLDIVDGVRGFNLEGNCLTRQGLNENLHTAAQTKD